MVKVIFHTIRNCSYGMENSYDVGSGSEIMPCNKIDKPLVVYRFMGNVLTSMTTLCGHNDKIITILGQK